MKVCQKPCFSQFQQIYGILLFFFLFIYLFFGIYLHFFAFENDLCFFLTSEKSCFPLEIKFDISSSIRGVCILNRTAIYFRKEHKHFEDYRNYRPS